MSKYAQLLCGLFVSAIMVFLTAGQANATIYFGTEGFESASWFSDDHDDKFNKRTHSSHNTRNDDIDVNRPEGSFDLKVTHDSGDHYGNDMHHYFDGYTNITSPIVYTCGFR